MGDEGEPEPEDTSIWNVHIVFANDVQALDNGCYAAVKIFPLLGTNGQSYHWCTGKIKVDLTRMGHLSCNHYPVPEHHLQTQYVTHSIYYCLLVRVHLHLPIN